jgi:plastocyanin
MIKCASVAVALAAGFAAAGCGDDDTTAATAARPAATPAGTVLKIGAIKSGSGAYRYDVKRLRAAAGRVTVEFVNGDTFAHNVRVQTGSTCCFKAGSEDAGGTDTINAATKAKATLTLKPGRYVFLCSIGGHWNGDTGRMRGSLVVS